MTFKNDDKVSEVNSKSEQDRSSSGENDSHSVRRETDHPLHTALHSLSASNVE